MRLQNIGGITSKCHHTKYKKQMLALITKKCVSRFCLTGARAKSTGDQMFVLGAHTGENNKMP